MLAVAISCILAGCATLRHEEVAKGSGPSAVVERLLERSYPPEQLGIAMAGEPGSQTIRWKEIITPKTPVTVALLPGDNASSQPRVAARINGSQPVPVSIDSGAALNVFDATFALAQGVKVADPRNFGNVFQGLGGREYAYYGMLDRVVFGDLAVQHLFTVLRTEGSAQTEQVDHILGLTTLAKFSYVTIDFPAERAIFSLEQAYEPVRPARAEAALTLKSLQLIIELQINREYAVNVLLDTGNDASLMLTEELIDALELRDAARLGKSEHFLGLGGGPVEGRTFRIEALGIGKSEFPSVEVTMMPNGFPPTLGAGFLKQFRTTLDFKRRRLWLE